MENIEIINSDCIGQMKNLNSSGIDCIITDPPYGIDFQSNYRNEKHIKIQNDDNLEWLPTFLNECYRVLKDNSHFYLFCSFHNLDVFMIEVKKRFQLKNIIVWEKNNTSMGDLKCDYAPKYEFILFITKGKRELNGTRKANIVKYSRTNNKYHPTEKPLELMRFLIRNSTNKNDRVLDPFMGSGTTGVACKELDRRFLGYEIERKHFLTTETRLLNVNRSLNIFTQE